VSLDEDDKKFLNLISDIADTKLIHSPEIKENE